MDYSPTPIGQWPNSFNSSKAWDWYLSPAIYERDLPLLQELNANAIRTYGWLNGNNHTAFLGTFNNFYFNFKLFIKFYLSKSFFFSYFYKDECYARGIYVVVGYSWDWTLYNSGSSGQQTMQNGINL